MDLSLDMLSTEAKTPPWSLSKKSTSTPRLVEIAFSTL